MGIPKIMAVMVLSASTMSAHAVLIEAGDFLDEVSRLRDLTFTSGSNLYVAPSNVERSQFRTLATTLASGDTATADIQAAALNYEVVSFTDSYSGSTFLGLRETLLGGVQTRGWGSYFFNTSATANVLIENNHPRFDTNSWDIAGQVFRDASAAGFLMAGAHRNTNGSGTADVAHLTQSIFQEVHEAWNGVNGERTAWSIHGFGLTNHPNMPVGTDVVLSAGDGSITDAMLEADAFFESAVFDSYGFNTLAANDPLNIQLNDGVDGGDFSTLGGTTNVQGIYSRGIGGNFIQVEMEQSIRFNSANRDLAASALVQAIVSLDAASVPLPSGLLLMVSAFLFIRKEPIS